VLPLQVRSRYDGLRKARLDGFMAGFNIIRWAADMVMLQVWSCCIQGCDHNLAHEQQACLLCCQAVTADAQASHNSRQVSCE
jgi:hypothetical protein